MAKNEEVFKILPLDLLVSASFQSHFPLVENDVRFKELVASIKESGIQHPLLVRPKEGKYEIAAGERRYRAAKIAGLSEVPVVVRKMDDLQAALAQGIENLQRQDLTEAEKSRYLAFLATEYHLTPEQIAEKTGMSYTWVVRYLPPEFKNKDKAEAGQKGGEAKAEAYRESQQSATSHVAPEDLEKAEKEVFEKPTAHCSDPSCLKPLREDEISVVDGKSYCLAHAPAAHLALLKRQKKEAQDKPVSPKSLDTAEEREARMHPHDSQFQLEVFTELAEEGLVFEQGQKLPVFLTEPDGLRYLNEERTEGLLVYLDNVEVHKGKKIDTGERLRDQYKKHNPGVTILAIPYKGRSDKEKARVKGLIREKYEFLKSEQQKWKTDISQSEEEEEQ